RLDRRAPALGLETLELGRTKKEAHAILSLIPESRLIPLPDGGYNLLVGGAAPQGAPFWPRQVFVRFDRGERVVEIRVRYQDGGPGTKDRPGLLDLLKRTNRQPEKIAATWMGLWTDLGPTPVPAHFRWLDDRTVVTYQRDAGGSEVIVRDCRKDSPYGVELAPLSFCSGGVAGCKLRGARADGVQRLQQDKPTMEGDAVLLPPPVGTPYDVVLVYFENDKATRIIAQYRKPMTGSDASDAIQTAWGDNIDQLGTVRRQDAPRPPALQSWSWHDDQTRVRLF